MFANLGQIMVAYPFRVAAHGSNNISNGSHSDNDTNTGIIVNSHRNPFGCALSHMLG